MSQCQVFELYSGRDTIMRDTNRETNKAGSKDRVHKILLDDIRKGGFLQNLKRELRDIYYFYLDHPTRVKLAGMSRFRRWIRVVFWIFKSMLKKLTPGRRLLMVLGLILLISRNEIPLGENTTMRIDTSTVGALFLLIVLMLELKDKLLAKDELAA
jgi:hypothetical protein